MLSPGFTRATGELVNKACASMMPLVVVPMPNWKCPGPIVGVGFHDFDEISSYALPLAVGAAGDPESTLREAKVSTKPVPGAVVTGCWGVADTGMEKLPWPLVLTAATS